MAGALLTRPAGTYDPISFFRHFNNIPLAPRMFAEFAETQRTKITIGVRREPSVMMNDVGVKLHDKPPYRPPPEALCVGSIVSLKQGWLLRFKPALKLLLLTKLGQPSAALQEAIFHG